MNICITIDPVTWTEKPPKKSIGAISNRILPENQKRIELKDLADTIFEADESSHCWTAGIYDGGRCNENWIESQLFSVDIDASMSIVRARELWEQYDIEPVLGYTTFSHTEEANRYRLVFCMAWPIKNIHFHYALQKSLIEIFKADTQHVDPSRIVNPGKEVFHSSENIVFPHEIFLAAVQIANENASKSNEKRAIESLCEKIGLRISRGEPAVSLVSADKFSARDAIYQKIDELPVGYYSIIYSRSGAFRQKCPEIILSSSDSIDHAEDSEVWEICFSEYKSPKSTEQSPRFEVRQQYENFEREKCGSHDWSKCQLFNDLNCSIYLHYPQRYHLWCNLQRESYGGETFTNAMRSSGKYDKDQIDAFEYNNKRNYNYKPQSCSSRICHYYDKCEPGANILQKCHIRKDQPIHITKEIPSTISITDAETRLRSFFIEEIYKDGDDIVIMNVPAGIGKSRLAIDVAGYLPLLLAVPTHELKGQHSKDFAKQYGIFPILVPDNLELSTRHQQELDRLYRIGAHSLALAKIRDFATSTFVTPQDKNKCNNYLDQLERSRDCSRTLITTHARLLYMSPGDIKHKAIIVDEDILKSILKNESCQLNDLSLLGNLIESSDDKAVIEEFIHKILSSESKTLHVPQKFNQILKDGKRKDIELRAAKGSIQTNVIDLLNATYVKVARKPDGIILSYIRRKDLFQDKKIIILSATPSADIYRLLYGERIREIRIDNVEHRGKIYQFAASFSRSMLAKHENPNQSNLDTLARALLLKKSGLPLITYKKHKNEYSAVMTFGAVEGKNDLKGKSIIVMGTNHLNEDAYKLIALELGANLDDIENDEIGYINIERNGYRFRFSTYKNNDILRMVQLHMIESELIQAVGRARHLREQCNVYLCSNLILPGTELINDFNKFYSLIQSEVVRLEKNMREIAASESAQELLPVPGKARPILRKIIYNKSTSNWDTSIDECQTQVH